MAKLSSEDEVNTGYNGKENGTLYHNRVYIGYVLEVIYGGYVGIIEKKIETIGMIQGLYKDFSVYEGILRGSGERSSGRHRFGQSRQSIVT